MALMNTHPKSRIEGNPKTHYNGIWQASGLEHLPHPQQQLLDYSRRYPAICQQTDADPETGCIEFDIKKGRFSFRLIAPYSEERREAARQYAREHNAADRLKWCEGGDRYYCDEKTGNVFLIPCDDIDNPELLCENISDFLNNLKNEES